MIVDTHVLLWFVASSPRLSARARQALRGSLAEGRALGVSVVSLVELTYLVEKGRVPEPHARRVIAEVRQDDQSAFELIPFDGGMATVPRNSVPDMPDRMIAATAVHMDRRLVTADTQLQRSVVPTLW